MLARLWSPFLQRSYSHASWSKHCLGKDKGKGKFKNKLQEQSAPQWNYIESCREDSIKLLKGFFFFLKKKVQRKVYYGRLIPPLSFILENTAGIYLHYTTFQTAGSKVTSWNTQYSLAQLFKNLQPARFTSSHKIMVLGYTMSFYFSPLNSASDLALNQQVFSKEFEYTVVL